MFFQDANDAILNVPAGFDTGLSSFDPSSPAALGDDGLGATDNLLGTLSLAAELGDKPIDVGGRTNRTALDDITPGSADPVGHRWLNRQSWQCSAQVLVWPP